VFSPVSESDIWRGENGHNFNGEKNVGASGGMGGGEAKHEELIRSAS
jgi:hypothetical protein